VIISIVVAALGWKGKTTAFKVLFILTFILVGTALD